MDGPKRITIKEVRSVEGFENVTDEQAEEIIDRLEELACILIEHYKLYPKKDEESRNPWDPN
ncbi:MAG: hypothetical protein MI921_27590 [Cytophagales bacterium]|nr:hypothetical protein [Cytophagales bacterium]